MPSLKITALIFPEIFLIQYRFSGTIYDVVTSLICIIQKRNISETKKDIAERKTAFFFTLESLSNKELLLFT